MAQQFKAGDIVQLKSGGPLMTVKTGDLEECYCEWFGSGNTLQTHEFTTANLKKAEVSAEMSLAELIVGSRARVASAKRH